MSQDSTFDDELIEKNNSQDRVLCRRKYSVHHKLQVVKMARRGISIRKISKTLRIYRSTVQNWMKNEHLLLQTRGRCGRFNRQYTS